MYDDDADAQMDITLVRRIVKIKSGMFKTVRVTESLQEDMGPATGPTYVSPAVATHTDSASTAAATASEATNTVSDVFPTYEYDMADIEIGRGHRTQKVNPFLHYGMQII